jgi:hypothetical protein
LFATFKESVYTDNAFALETTEDYYN